MDSTPTYTGLVIRAGGQPQDTHIAANVAKDRQGRDIGRPACGGLLAQAAPAVLTEDTCCPGCWARWVAQQEPAEAVAR